MNLKPFLLLALLAFMLVPSVYATTTTETWNCRNDQQTVNTVTGYALNTTATTGASVNVSLSSDAHDSLTAVRCGWRIWIVYPSGSEVEYTSGSPTATISWVTTGAALFNTTWTSSAQSLQTGFDAFKFCLYMQLNDDPWVLMATFVGDLMMYPSISGSTWTFFVYVEKTWSDPTLTGRVYWGNSTAATRIEGIVFEDPDVYEMMQHKLHSGDFVGFVVYPYTNLVGNAFYGIVLLILCVPLYVRYKSLTPIILVFVLFGGTGGLVGLLIPEIGTGITWIVLLFGVAGLLYKVFR